PQPLPRRHRHVHRRHVVPLLIMRPFVLASLICGAAAAQQADPDAVRVHVLEKRPFTESGRWELSLFGTTQVNPKFTVHTGLGAARTRVQLRPSSDPSTGRTFGDTGFRPIASLGLGLRVFLGEQLTVRVELRDFAYSGYVSRVNGCNQADAAKIEIAEANNQT